MTVKQRRQQQAATARAALAAKRAEAKSKLLIHLSPDEAKYLMSHLDGDPHGAAVKQKIVDRAFELITT